MICSAGIAISLSMCLIAIDAYTLRNKWIGYLPCLLIESRYSGKFWSMRWLRLQAKQLCCGYTLTDFSISIRPTSLALWQSNDCPSASKATLMNMDKYFMWIHYERLHNHNIAKHNKTVCIFLGIYCATDHEDLPWRCITQHGVAYEFRAVIRRMPRNNKIFR